MKIDILKCECINVWTCAFKMTTLLVTFMVYSERKLLWKSSKFREIFFRISHPGEFFLQSIYHWNFAKMNFSKDSENDAKFQGIKYATILRKFIKMFASLSKFRINLFCGKNSLDGMQKIAKFLRNNIIFRWKPTIKKLFRRVKLLWL